MTDRVRSKALRIATLALLLWRGEEVTAVDAALRFGVSKRTAQRDLMDVGEILPLAERLVLAPNGKTMRPCYRLFRKEEVA